MSDPFDLAVRRGPPPDWAWLSDRLPRERWSDPDLHPTARFWLQMHDGFRREHALMLEVARQDGDPAARHPQLIGLLQGFLQHLDGHHRIESGHYFPRFRALEPRIRSGLDLLDRDHDAVHAHLEALFRTGSAYHQAVSARAPDVTDRLARLTDALQAAHAPLLRHLDDEEDIVIPLIAAHDPDET